LPRTWQRRDKLFVKAERAEHLRIAVSVMSWKIVAQMLCPYELVTEDANN
jgi:hypothetical protein